MDNQVKAGSVIRDNDPRREGRTVTVLRIASRYGEAFAEYQAGKRKAYVRLDRIGLTGHKGWSVVFY